MSVDDKVKHSGLLLDEKQVVWSFWFHSGSVSHGFVRDLVLSKCKSKTECNLQSLSAEKTVYTNLPKHDEVKALSHYCGRTLKIWVIYESNSLIIIWRYHSSSPLGRGTVYWMSRKFSPIFSGVEAEGRGRGGGGGRGGVVWYSKKTVYVRLSSFELRDCDGVQRQDGVTNLIFCSLLFQRLLVVSRVLKVMKDCLTPQFVARMESLTKTFAISL